MRADALNVRSGTLASRAATANSTPSSTDGRRTAHRRIAVSRCSSLSAASCRGVGTGPVTGSPVRCSRR